MGTYLDKTGLQTLWAKIKERDTATLNAAKNDASAKDTALLNDIAASYIALTLKGAANGVAPLDASKRIPTEYLPGYVDDVVEGTYVNSTTFNNTSGTAITGEASKIYVSTDTNKTYRWSGSAYVEISASLALGETTGTAYDGGKGAVLAQQIENLEGALTENYYTITETDSLIENMVEWNTKPATNTQSIITSYQGKIKASSYSITEIFYDTKTIPTGEAIAEYLDENYQPKLVSGTNVKTVNGQSILGSGNISIEVDDLDMSGYYTKTETDGLLDGYLPLTGGTISSSLTTSKILINPYQIYMYDTDNKKATTFAVGKILHWVGGATIYDDEVTYTYTFPEKSGTFVVQNENGQIEVPGNGGMVFSNGSFTNNADGYPIISSKDGSFLGINSTSGSMAWLTFPESNGTLALTSDIPEVSAITTAEIDEICV